MGVDPKIVGLHPGEHCVGDLLRGDALGGQHGSHQLALPRADTMVVGTEGIRENRRRDGSRQYSRDANADSLGLKLVEQTLR